MKIFCRRRCWILTPLALIFCAWLFAGNNTARAQVLDFGYVPIHTTNTVPGLSMNGGGFVDSESFSGSYAADFATSPDYTGQTLTLGQAYPFSLSFAPHATGFETTTFTASETFGSAVLALQAVGAPTNQPGTGPVVPELAPLEQAMTNFLAAHKFEAGTLALMHGSRLVFRQGYGWRDTNFTAVIHPDNLFRLASVSKMLTESAIYKLAAAGKFTTNTLMYSYLGIPPYGGTLGDARIPNITIQELLNHSGGWVVTNSDNVFNTVAVSTAMGLSHPASANDMVSWMFSRPLDFTPGTTTAYSNFGYQILGRIIEKASGKSYINYLQQDLLGAGGITSPLGITNVVQTASRPRDLAPWEIWYADYPQFLVQSAVDYPTNLTVRVIDGGFYYESYDAFGGVSASAVGLCHYLLNYLEGGAARPTSGSFGWNTDFYGSLPGTTAVLHQNITQSPTATNGLEFAALFNVRDSVSEDLPDNTQIDNAITTAATGITSWPTNGGGMVQWSVATTNVNKTGGSITVPLVRTGTSTLPVKVSYTTYALTASSANYTTTAGIATFAAGVTNVNVTVPILNDHVTDPPKQFTLELISASGGAWLGDRFTAVVNILDTNPPPPVISSPVKLGNGNFQFQLSATIGAVVTVQYSTNLPAWQTLKVFTNGSPTTTITDTNTTGRGRSFYRVSTP